MKKHGKGCIYFKSGDKFSGHFLGGKIEGFGEYHTKDGELIKGEWLNGMLQIDTTTQQPLG